MCNNYASHVPAQALADAFSETGFPLRFEGGAVPNLEPRDDIRIGDTAPIVIPAQDGPSLIQAPWAWKAPNGRPVFNFKSDGRSFAHSDRCLIPADAFYEFTAPEPGQKRKTKWRFTMTGEPWFWVAGLVKDGAWAMLTTAPGADIAPFHDRQIVLLRRAQALEWLDLTRPEADLLAPAPAGSLAVEKVFPNRMDDSR